MSGDLPAFAHAPVMAAMSAGIGAGGMALLLAHLCVGPHWNTAMRTMALAVALSATWAGCALAFALAPSDSLWIALRWLERLRAGAWVGFLLVLLATDGPSPSNPGRAARRGMAMFLALLATVAAGALLPMPAPGASDSAASSSAAAFASVALAVAGLVCLEQLLRNVASRQRWNVWPLAIALGAMFAYDLYLYSDAVLLGRLDAVAWSVQAAVAACAAPLLGAAVARNGWWSRPLAVSHGAAFHTTVLLASATYLLGVAGVGYAVRFLGGAWGPALQIALFVAALMVLGVLLTLGSARARLRVLIGKHFFERRYDYRQEWLRFTRLLASGDDGADLHVRCIQALADLVESTGGSVWMRREDGFRQLGQWNVPVQRAAEPADGDLASFLARSGWVVDVDECRRAPQRYGQLVLPGWLHALPGAWLVLPLAAADKLVGFVVLTAPRTDVVLDWEVRDLLKTAGSEVALLLRQAEAEQALAEAEKFAAVNRMSTFVVHDLKNLVAQLSLLLRNAERHGENPEFRRDMLDTVRHVVERMNGMLAQARLSGRPLANPQSVDLAPLLQRVCDHKRAQHPGLEATFPGPVHALGHADRLEHVFAHVVQNAIDATPSQRAIRVSLRDGDPPCVEIADEGCGMTPDFVQHRLFRPFQTTKAAGMGIGVYESQQYVASLGGRLEIDSAPGQGTRVRITLPSAHAPISRHSAPDTASDRWKNASLC